MPSTNLSSRLRTVIVVSCTVLVAALPFASLPAAADPQQPVRALVAGLALVIGALLGVDTPGRRLRMAGFGVAGLAALYLLSALINGPASAVFGLYGRFQGLVAGLLLVSAGTLGGLVLHRHARTLAVAVAVSAAAQSFVMLVQAVQKVDTAGTMSNRVLAGSWLATAAAVALATALSSRGAARAWLYAAAGMAALGVGLSGSRGAWLGLAAGVVAALAVSRNRRVIAIGAAAAVCVLLAGVALAGPESLGKLNPQALGSGSAASRWQIWRGTVAMIQANPVLGVGPGRFLFEFPAFQPIEHAAIEARDTRADQAHGELLHVAAESGVPAALLAIGLLGTALVSGAQASRQRDGAGFIAFAGLTAYAVQALFGIATIETGVLAWVLGGIAITRADIVHALPDKPARRTDPLSSRSAPLAWSLVAAGALVAGLCAWYLAADLQHARAQALFESGDFAGAQAADARASALNPLVDLYRVGQSDAARYLGGAAIDPALASVEAGIALEPRSYDLVLARARLLRAAGQPENEVVEAYERAVALYPQGIEVRTEAVQVLQDLGRHERARELQAGIDELERLRLRMETGTR